MHKSDFAPCQAFGAQAREHRVEWIRYAAVRVPGGICGAVLAVAALTVPEADQLEILKWLGVRIL